MLYTISAKEALTNRTDQLVIKIKLLTPYRRQRSGVGDSRATSLHYGQAW